MTLVIVFLDSESAVSGFDSNRIVSHCCEAETFGYPLRDETEASPYHVEYPSLGTLDAF